MRATNGSARLLATAGLAFFGIALGGCGAGSKSVGEAHSDAALIAAKPPGTNAIIVRAFGSGSGSIALSEGTLTCFDPHEEDYTPHEAKQICWAYLDPSASTATAAAMPLAGSLFTAWTAGPCADSTEPACTVSMDTDRVLALRFERARLAAPTEVTIHADVLGFVDGDLTATATPPPEGGLDWRCTVYDFEDRVSTRRSCSASVPAGTVVTLTATPPVGTYFAGWGGSCTGTSPCTLTMDRHRGVTASFARASPELVLVSADVADSTASSIVQVVNVARGGGPARPIGQVCRAVDGRNLILGLDAAGRVVHLAIHFPPPGGVATRLPELSLGADSTALGLFLGALAGIVEDGRGGALVEPWIRAQPEFPLVAETVRVLVETRGHLDDAAPEAATLADLVDAVARRIAEQVVFDPQEPPASGVCALRELIGSCYLPGKGIRIDWVPSPGDPCRSVRITFQNPNPHWTKIVFTSDGSTPPQPGVKPLAPKDWVPDATFSSIATSLWAYVDAVAERSLDPLDFEATTVDVTLAPDATSLTISAMDRDPYVITLNAISGVARLLPVDVPVDVAAAVDAALDLPARWQAYSEDPIAFVEDITPTVANFVGDLTATRLTTELFTTVNEAGLRTAARAAGVVKDAVYAPFYAYSMLSDGEAQVTISADALFGTACASAEPPPGGGAVSGAVGGAVASGVALTLTGPAAGTAVTDESGGYAFAALPSGTYTVTPSLAGYVFDPPSRTVTIAGAAVTGVDFVAAATSYEWFATASMAVARLAHTATLLPAGDVLVTGGQSYPWWIVEHSAELYDPETGTWSDTGPMATARYNHTATLLASGKVLVVGGYTATAELYDPETGTWSDTGPMAAARYNHTATLLASGEVLVVGGGNDGLASAEIYDPASGEWTATGSLSQRRTRHTAVRLLSGEVLVAGGYSFPVPLGSAEVYDPATGVWTQTGSLAALRIDATATVLGTGRVLVVGGESRLAELYDPTTRTWSAAGVLDAERTNHTATLLPSGEVLIAGGTLVPYAELFDPVTETWSSGGALVNPRAAHTATLLGGEVLLTGGIVGVASATAELAR